MNAQVLAKAAKAAGREPTGYAALCDDVYCNVCRKRRGEKSPWNRPPQRGR